MGRLQRYVDNPSHPSDHDIVDLDLAWADNDFYDQQSQAPVAYSDSDWDMVDSARQMLWLEESDQGDAISQEELFTILGIAVLVAALLVVVKMVVDMIVKHPAMRWTVRFVNGVRRTVNNMGIAYYEDRQENLKIAREVLDEQFDPHVSEADYWVMVSPPLWMINLFIGAQALYKDGLGQLTDNVKVLRKMTRSKIGQREQQEINTTRQKSYQLLDQLSLDFLGKVGETSYGSNGQEGIDAAQAHLKRLQERFDQADQRASDRASETMAQGVVFGIYSKNMSSLTQSVEQYDSQALDAIDKNDVEEKVEKIRNQLEKMRRSELSFSGEISDPTQQKAIQTDVNQLCQDMNAFLSNVGRMISFQHLLLERERNNFRRIGKTAKAIRNKN